MFKGKESGAACRSPFARACAGIFPRRTCVITFDFFFFFAGILSKMLSLHPYTKKVISLWRK
jgi:hypothetical protein